MLAPVPTARPELEAGTDKSVATVPGRAVSVRHGEAGRIRHVRTLCDDVPLALAERSRHLSDIDEHVHEALRRDRGGHVQVVRVHQLLRLVSFS